MSNIYNIDSIDRGIGINTQNTKVNADMTDASENSSFDELLNSMLVEQNRNAAGFGVSGSESSSEPNRVISSLEQMERVGSPSSGVSLDDLAALSRLAFGRG